MVAAALSTASSYRARGTISLVVSAQPWPAWMHTLNAVSAAAAARSQSPRSQSSSTIAADLPPSSRKTFLVVAAALAMTSRPVAVEPVNETRSTRGSAVSCRPASGRLLVTTLTTPAGISVCSATQPAQLGAGPGRVRGRLEHDRAAGRERRAELGQGDLVGEVPRGDRGDDPGGLSADPAAGRDAHRPGDTEVLLPLVGLQQVGDVVQAVDRDAELRAVGPHRRYAGLGDRDLAQLPRSPRPGLTSAGAGSGCGRPGQSASQSRRRRDGQRRLLHRCRRRTRPVRGRLLAR